MSDFNKIVDGAMDKAKGKGKETLGKLTDDEKKESIKNKTEDLKTKTKEKAVDLKEKYNKK